MRTDQAFFTLLDGPLLPNDALETAAAASLEAPDDIAVGADGALLVADGASVMRFDGDDLSQPQLLGRFGGPVTALCRGAGATAVVAVAGEGLHILSTESGKTSLLSAAGPLVHAVTACRMTADGAVLATRATTEAGDYPFTHELFAARGSGQVLRVSADGECTVLATGLHGPHGVAEAAGGAILVAETWGAAVRLLEPSGTLRTVLANFAGYPGRLAPLAAGGFVMACLSRRDPLVDFVRGERAFAARMMREIAPEHWVAPRLDSRIDVNVPAQAGATRLFGEIKPWAPSLSYGLVVALDGDFVPYASFHSRANGLRHGITGVAEWNGRIVAVSKATGEVLFMEPRGKSHDG